MKYIVVLITFLFLFAGCHKDTKSIDPTGSYDTLGIHWTTIEQTNIIYYFQDFSSQSGYAKAYVDEHEDAYTSLNKVFNAKMPRKLRFFIWADTALARQLLNSPLGFTVPQLCICYVWSNQSLGHEMTHALTFWADGVPPTKLTRFINEGVAVAFNLNLDNKIETAKAAIVGQNIHSVTDFWTGSLQSAPEEVFYPVAGAFMDYLYKQNLPDEFNAFLKDQSFESAQNIYGKDRLNSLIANFDSLLGLK